MKPPKETKNRENSQMNDQAEEEQKEKNEKEGRQIAKNKRLTISNPPKGMAANILTNSPKPTNKSPRTPRTRPTANSPKRPFDQLESNTPKGPRTSPRISRLKSPKTSSENKNFDPSPKASSSRPSPAKKTPEEMCKLYRNLFGDSFNGRHYKQKPENNSENVDDDDKAEDLKDDDVDYVQPALPIKKRKSVRNE